MSVTTLDKNIIIAVDPGFDSVKVVTNNGVMFKVPKEVADVTNKKFLDAKDDNYIMMHYMEGKEHLVGLSAAKYLNNVVNDAKMGEEAKAEINDTFASFETADMQIRIMTGIAMALIKLAKTDKTVITLKKNEDGSYNVNAGRADIAIGVALPHDIVDDKWSYIQKYLNERQIFDIETNEGLFHIEFEAKTTAKASQVVVALLGAISGEEGIINMNDSLLSNDSLPALVIDGGMKTLGKFLFSKAKSIEDGESNQKYAMINVHEKVAKVIREEYNRPEFTARRVKRVVEEGEMIPYLKEDGSSDKIDVKAMVAKELEVTCREMVDEFYEKYNKLLDIKSVLITGGTGAAYFECLKKILNKERDWVKVVLTDYSFYGKSISPEYGIAVGMFKALYHRENR